MVALINQWRHTAAELELQLGRSPDIEEMADIMQLSLRKAGIINQVVKTLGSVKDVSGKENSDEDQLLEATLEDENGGQPEDELVADEQKLKLLRLLEEIEPREAKILKMHYGLDGNKPLGLREIGNKLGLTRERIRQIQRDVLTRLYEYMEE
jgi:RNA polymerase primary sigma factor